MRSQNEPIQLYPSLPHLHQFHHLRESEDYNKSGQALFTALKLRSEGLVPSSGAQSAPANSTCGSSTARLFPPRRALRSETCGRSAPRFAHKREYGHGVLVSPPPPQGISRICTTGSRARSGAAGLRPLPYLKPGLWRKWRCWRELKRSRPVNDETALL